MSGYLDGPPGGHRTRHARSARTQAFRPFWDTYHTITERYAGGEVDREAIIQGAIRGMIEALGDPYSSYLTSEEYRDSLQGISGEFEGIGAEIATQDAEWRRRAAPRSGPTCRLVIVAPIERLAGREGRPPGRRPRARVPTGSPFDGLTVDGAGDRIRGPKGTRRRPDRRARRRRRPFDLSITRDVILQGRSSQPDSRRRDGRLRPAERLLRSRRRGGAPRRSRPTSTAGRTQG